MNSNLEKKYLSSEKYNTYLEIYGKIKKNSIPIIFIHGGPGANLEYLLSLKSFEINEPIIFYDQINSGKSTSIYKNNLLQINHFIEQLHLIINKLEINQCHLIGHSWGSLIAHEYYLKNPNYIKTIIFYSPSLDIKLWQRQADFYLKEIKENCLECNINEQYTKKHIGDINKITKFLKNQNSNLYNHIWGKSEYKVNGLLKNYNYIPNKMLQKIKVLFITGEYDTASPNCLKILSNQIPNSQVRIISKARHVVHFDKLKEFKSELIYFYKEYYQEKFLKKYVLYRNQLFNNNEINSKTLSNKLIFLFMIKKQEGKKIKKELENLINDIIKFIKYPKSNNNLQARLDFWYYVKLINSDFNLKPSPLFFKKVLEKFDNLDKITEPKNAILAYIYIRILIECDYKKYNYLTRHIEYLKEFCKRDKIIYGYFLTHVILYDLKFNFISYQDIKDKEQINNAISELVTLCKKNKDLFDVKNSDLLGEILLCFRLCFFNDNNIYLNIYNILAKVPTNNINFHLNTVLAIASYPFNFENKFNLLRDILKLLIVLFIIMLILKKKKQ